MKPEIILFWLAVSLYGVSAFSYVFGLMSKKEKLLSLGFFSAIAGLAPHMASIGFRWAETGINPFIAISESISFAMAITVLIFMLFQFSNKKVRPLGVLVMPIAFTLMGWAGTLMEGAATRIAPALQSWWIWIHIFGAATGFSAVLMAAGFGLMFLLKEKKQGGIYDKMPDQQALDNYAYRFVLGGFIMYGLMIVSGAFWSNQVKGNYWGWDPVEVWSLISWLTYGIYLHLRITMGWRGKRLAWYAIIAMLAMIISYWGIPFSVETFHSGFRIEH